MLKGNDCPGISAQAERYRRRDAPAVLFGMLTPGHTTVFQQQVEAHGGAVVDHLIGIQGQAFTGFGIVLVKGIADAATNKLFHGRGLGHQVDVTTGPTPAVVGRRALGHFN